MKISKLLFLSLALFTLTACNSTKESTTTSSTQTNLSKEPNPTIDRTEETAQKERINIDFLYGEWESIDEDTEDYMVIDKINDDTIKYFDNLDRKNSKVLKIKEASENSVTALTKDERTSYNFILSEDGKTLTSFSGVNGAYYTDKGKEAPTGVTEARKYVMMIKCGTEDVSTDFTLEEIPKGEENEGLPIVDNKK